MIIHLVSFGQIMAGRPRETTDEQLLAATARAISAVGPGRLTLAHVAGEAGVAPATIVQRFGSKRSLLLAFTAAASADLEQQFSTRRKAHRSPLRALVEQLVAMAHALRSPDELANHLAFLQLELSDPEFLHHTQRHAQAMRTQMRLLLDEAVALGELGPCNTTRLADALHVTHNGALVTWAIFRSGSIDHWLRRELETVLRPHRREHHGPRGSGAPAGLSQRRRTKGRV